MANHTTVEEIFRSEHEDNTVQARKAVLYGWDPDNLEYLKIVTNDEGELKVNLEPAATDMEGGGKISVGTSAVEATFTGATKSIIISADVANTGTLYIGKSNVTDAGANAIAFLLAGESIVIDYDDASNAVYVVATAASQNFWKGALIV